MRNLKKIWIVFFLIWLTLLPAHAFVSETPTYGTSLQLLRACSAEGETNVETDFGNLAADAMRDAGDAMIALLPSVEIGTNLQKGPITEAALEACLQQNSRLYVVCLSPAALYETLEQGISHFTLRPDRTVDWEKTHYDGYLQVSGIHVIYDVADSSGERVWSAELEDGTPLEREDDGTELSVVMTEPMVFGEYGYSVQNNSEQRLGTLRDALRDYVLASGTISAPASGRTEIRGTRDWTVKLRTLVLVVAFLAILIFGHVSLRERKRSKTSPYGFTPDDNYALGGWDSAIRRKRG